MGELRRCYSVHMLCAAAYAALALRATAMRRCVQPARMLSDGPFEGAGLPRPELAPDELPPLLMRALCRNDFPEVDDGLRSVWTFAGDTMRFIYKNNVTEFIADAHETATSLPTSFYGTAMHGQSWEMEGSVNMVGNDPESCWIATQIMKTVSSDGRLRRWQWGARARMPPCSLAPRICLSRALCLVRACALAQSCESTGDHQTWALGTSRA